MRLSDWARANGVRPDTARQWARTGKIEARLINGVWVVEDGHVETDSASGGAADHDATTGLGAGAEDRAAREEQGGQAQEGPTQLDLLARAAIGDVGIALLGLRGLVASFEWCKTAVALREEATQPARDMIAATDVNINHALASIAAYNEERLK